MQYEFVQNDTGDYGHYVMNVLSSQGPSGTRALGILDHNGYLVWYKPNPNFTDMSFDYHESQSHFSFIEGALGNPFGVRMLDEQLNFSDSIVADTGGRLDAHEFLWLDNGNYLTFSVYNSTVDLSTDTFDGLPGSATTSVLDVRINEYDANKNIVFTWEGLDHIAASEFYDFYNYDANNFDYIHPNAMALDANGNIMMSARHQCHLLHRSWKRRHPLAPWRQIKHVHLSQ
jgi:hypothetical protein